MLCLYEAWWLFRLEAKYPSQVPTPQRQAKAGEQTDETRAHHMHLSRPDPLDAGHTGKRQAAQEAPEQVRAADERGKVGEEQRKRQHHPEEGPVPCPHQTSSVAAGVSRGHFCSSRAEAFFER